MITDICLCGDQRLIVNGSLDARLCAQSARECYGMMHETSLIHQIYAVEVEDWQIGPTVTFLLLLCPHIYF